ncbi:MAG: hypothetical protein PHW03_06640 [Eubacteriales bacterium]|nr:hypothetical protein [Eubacteriales bacterium]MDD4390464.1 hypothetical protein [Eubacteriales bacterium]
MLPAHAGVIPPHEAFSVAVGITMRKIAKKMGSCVAPIYANFKNVDELNEALKKRIISISQQLLMEKNTGNQFRDMGNASLRFAIEYNVIFRDLVTIGMAMCYFTHGRRFADKSFSNIRLYQHRNREKNFHFTN